MFRLASGVPSADLAGDQAFLTLKSLLSKRWCRLETSDELKLHETLLLAATLPDDDFEAFVLATLILLSDQMLEGAGPDDLYHHWQAFQPHYHLIPTTSRMLVWLAFYEQQKRGDFPSATVTIPADMVKIETAEREDIHWPETGQSMLNLPVSARCHLRRVFETDQSFDPYPGQLFGPEALGCVLLPTCDDIGPPPKPS